ncbi:MAG: hypothetical protein WB757_11590 [Candidatus Cybelea sp.]
MNLSRRRKWALVVLLAFWVAIGTGQYFMGQARFSEVFPPVLIYLGMISIVIFYWLSPPRSF